MPETASQSRAWTRIDSAMARVSGCGLERAWSLITGATAELRDSARGQEWLAHGGDEFRLRIGGVVYTAMDFGDSTWSDEADPHGAAIEARHRRGPWLITIRTAAFHGVAGLLRTFSFRNLAADPVLIDAVAVETLPLRRDGARLFTTAFATPHDAGVFESEEPGVALSDGERGLILGAECGGRYALFDPDPGCCSLSHRPAAPIAPLAQWEAPAACLVPFAGPPADQAPKALGAFLSRVKQYRWWLTEGRFHAAPDGSTA